MHVRVDHQSTECAITPFIVLTQLLISSRGYNGAFVAFVFALIGCWDRVWSCRVEGSFLTTEVLRSDAACRFVGFDSISVIAFLDQQSNDIYSPYCSVQVLFCDWYALFLIC